MFPIVLNLFEFTPEEHTLSIVATDSTQLSSSYQYTFFGRTPPGMFCMETFILQGHVRILVCLYATDSYATVQTTY